MKRVTISDRMLDDVTWRGWSDVWLDCPLFDIESTVTAALERMPANVRRVTVTYIPRFASGYREICERKNIGIVWTTALSPVRRWDGKFATKISSTLKA